jgi:hypothetical protein
VMTTESMELEQTPLLMTHLKTALVPGWRPVTPLLAEVGEVIVTPGEVVVHCPVPNVGVLPCNVALPTQTVWSWPALDVVGAWKTVMPCVVLT